MKQLDGAQIRTLREARLSLTRAEFAKKVAQSPAWVKQLEGTGRVREALVPKLARALGVEISTIDPSASPFTFGWSGVIEERFLSGDNHLRVMFKDGRSFLESASRRELLGQRFRNTKLKTEFLLLDPFTPWIEAVSSMDVSKAGRPSTQFANSVAALSTLRAIADSVTDGELNSRLSIRLYPYVPAWTGFISEVRAQCANYFTRPHRGELLGWRAAASDERYTHLMNDYTEIFGSTQCREMDLGGPWVFPKFGTPAYQQRREEIAKQLLL